MTRFKLTQHDLYYQVRKSKRTKRHKIMVYADKIEVIIPYRSSYIRAKDLIEQKQHWVVNQWNNMQLTRKKVELFDVTTSTTLQYLGHLLPFTLQEGKVVLPECQNDSHTITLRIPYYYPKLKKQALLHQCLYDWLTAQLLQHIQIYIAHYSAPLAVMPKKLEIKTYRGRWGSCNKQKTLGFNFSLVFAPIAVIEYVVVHELCHLRYMDHSVKFWQLVASQLPDYKKAQKWLKEHHEIIHYFPKLPNKTT
jgi:predicted metal-dependent hydrolase